MKWKKTKRSNKNHWFHCWTKNRIDVRLHVAMLDSLFVYGKSDKKNEKMSIDERICAGEKNRLRHVFCFCLKRVAISICNDRRIRCDSLSWSSTNRFRHVVILDVYFAKRTMNRKKETNEPITPTNHTHSRTCGRINWKVFDWISWLLNFLFALNCTALYLATIPSLSYTFYSNCPSPVLSKRKKKKFRRKWKSLIVRCRRTIFPVHYIIVCPFRAE